MLPEFQSSTDVFARAAAALYIYLVGRKCEQEKKKVQDKGRTQ